jgi:hypothetical protein
MSPDMPLLISSEGNFVCRLQHARQSGKRHKTEIKSANASDGTKRN